MVVSGFDSLGGFLRSLTIKTYKMKQIEVYSEAWVSLLSEIAEQYADGNLITHEWLKDKFGLKELKLEDFDSVEEFVKGLQYQQFAYMTLVDTLRWQLLEQEKMYIRNIRGDGYEVVNEKDQVKYGYDEFLRTVKKAIKEADLIMNNVRPVPNENQYKDNDLRAKCSMLKQMLLSVKNRQYEG